MRFQRHFRLPGFGESQQLRLKGAHVLVIGIGGLGNPVAQYLSAAGVGTITLADFDSVDVSNLHRQVLFGVDDIGLPKVHVAVKKLQSLHPETTYRGFEQRVNNTSLPSLLEGIDLVADCSDNFETRYILDDTLLNRGIPVVSGAVHRHEGHIALFHGSTGVRYRDAYPHTPAAGRIGNCEAEGVSGPVTGIIGSMMAQCIMDYLAFGHSAADGRIIRYDGSDFSIYSAEIPKQVGHSQDANPIRSLNLTEALTHISTTAGLQLIDVRERHEHDLYNIGGKCLPAGELKEWSKQLTNEPCLLYCNRGILSFQVARALKQLMPTLHIMNLEGGLDNGIHLAQPIDLKEPATNT